MNPARSQSVPDHHCPTCADEGVPMTVSEARGHGLAVCTGEDGASHEVLTALVDPVAPGDLLLVHAGTALIRLAQGGDA